MDTIRIIAFFPPSNIPAQKAFNESKLSLVKMDLILCGETAGMKSEISVPGRSRRRCAPDLIILLYRVFMEFPITRHLEGLGVCPE